MTLHVVKPEHEVAYQDLCNLVSKHADTMTGTELLAVAANMLGKLIALQDQRTMSPDLAMQIVINNILHGNREVVNQLHQSQGRG